MLSKHGSALKPTKLAPPGGLFGSQQHPDDNVEGSENNAGNTASQDTEFGQPSNQIHPPRGYCYLPLQPPFPGALQFYHHAPFNMTPSSQPSTAATQEYQSYAPSWQAYDFPQQGYGGPHIFPPQQFTAHGRTSPGTPRVPPTPPQNTPVIRPTTSSSTAPEQPPGAPGKPPSSLPTKRFLPPAELWRAELAGIAELPGLPGISFHQYDADCESDDSSDLGGADDKAPIRLKQTEFSLKQFANRMRKPNFGAFIKWKKV
jgi:hypothetical protein